MLSLESPAVRLTIADDGVKVTLEDIRRGCRWRLDPSARVFRRSADQPTTSAVAEHTSAPAQPLPPGEARRQGSAIVCTHKTPGGVLRFTWHVAQDHIAVGLEADADGVDFAALPGSFVPEEGRPRALLPIYQGVLFQGGSDLWEEGARPGGHSRWSMAMGAMLGRSGALLVTQETPTDWVGVRGQNAAGPLFRFEQHRCPVNGWYPREVRLYPVDASITAVAKRYRRRVIERGEFASWDDKIARRPILEKLFGALIAFIGYNQSSEVDYVGCAAKLRALGFETVLYYPTRIWQYSLDFTMGGDAPIWMSDQELARLKEVPGALVAPWGWCYEGLDDGSERMRAIFRRDEAGAPIPNWRIEDKTWHLVCTPYQVADVKKRYETDMRAMDWVHYDVGAMNLGLPCFSREHELHGGRPMGRREDMKWSLELLGPATNGNRIVSAEGFVDRYTVSYDVGSTKLLPACGDAPFIPVPLTMLVFHDSAVHDWWELHNYNANPGFGLSSQRFGRTGSGCPEKKAAMDALYGCPPNLFPFGKQYAWLDWETRRTFAFRMSLEDEQVQRAIRAALPLIRLHKRIGRCELLSFDAVTPDFAVQTTTYSDGTRVVANISDEDRETDEFGRLPANTWVETR